MNYGRVVVFRKGKSSAPYELEEGTHSIGSSSESNIRLKFTHPLLLETHALIQVSEDGIATITNKSVGAPVRVNGKPIVRSTILRHEDKFEVLEKVFQYFNESLIDETESDKKIVKEKRHILAKSSRKSVNPLIKTPAKKSPNLKTKIPSLRKTMSDVKVASQPRNSFQVLVTPNNRPERSNGSKTMSKIIVSKALGAPSSKKRLSLDTSVKKSQSPQISSRNILLSKSTINITISEEHEYTKLTPSKSMRTIQEYDLLENNEIQTKRTPKKSIKLEKDESMCLIGFGTPDAPAVNTPDKKTPLKRQSNIKAVTTDDLTSNTINTPVNKRIQALKNVRHSIKKDTPPPRSSMPKIIVQAPTPQRRSSLRKTISATTSEDSDILVTLSPNAEPSKHNHSLKESTTPKKSLKTFEESGDQVNKSRVSFAVQAPNENSNLDFEATNMSALLVNETNNEQDQLNSLRKSTNVLSENTEPTKSRRSTRYSLSSSKNLEDPLETSVSKNSKIFRASVGHQKSNQKVLLMESSEESTDVDEKIMKKSNRKSFRDIIISASPDNSDGDRKSMRKSAGKKSVNPSAEESFEEDTSRKFTLESRKRLSNKNAEDEDNLLNNSLLTINQTSPSKSQKRSLRYSINKSILSAKNDSFSYSPNVSLNNTSKVSVNNDLVSEDENLAEPLDHSFNSSKSSRNVELNSTKSSISDLDIDAISDRLEKSLNNLEDVSTTKKTPTSNNSRRSVKIQNVDSCEEMDALYVDKTVYSSLSRTSSIPEKSRTPQIVSTTMNKSLGNNSRRSLQIQKIDVTSSEEMDELCVDETVYSSRLRTSSIPEKSRASLNVSPTKKKSLPNTRKSEESQNVNDSCSDEMDELCVDETVYSSRFRTSTIPEKSRKSQNVSLTKKKSLSQTRKSEKGQNVDASFSDEMDELCVDETVYSSRARTSSIPEKSRPSQYASRVSTRFEKSLGTSRNDVTSPKVGNNSLGLSRNNSRISLSALQDDGNDSKENSFNASKKSTRISKIASRQSSNYNNSTDSSANEDKAVELQENISKSGSISLNASKKSTRLSKNVSRQSSNFDNSTDSSANEDNDVELQENISKSGSISLNASKKSTRLSKNAARQSSNFDKSTDSSANEDNALELQENISKSGSISLNASKKSTRLSKNASRQSSNFDNSTDSSANEDNAVKLQENISKSGSISLNASKKSTRLSKNASRQGSNFDNSTDSSDDVDNAVELQENISKSGSISLNASKKSTRLSKKASRQSNNFDNSTDLSADENNAVELQENISKSGSISMNAVGEDLSLELVDPNNTEKRNLSRSSRLSRNTTQRNVSPEVFNSSLNANQTTTEAYNVNGTSKLPRDISNRGIFVELDDSTQSDEEKESSAKMSRNTSRRSTKTSFKRNESNIEENNISKSSRLSGNYSRRSKSLRNSSQTDKNSTDNENNLNTSSRMSRNSSRLSKSNLPLFSKDETIDKSKSLESMGVEDECNSLLVEDNTIDEDNNGNNSSRSRGNYSRRSTLPLKNSSQIINKSISLGSTGAEDLNTSDENIIGNKSSRLSRNKSRSVAPGSQSSIDSAETTMDTHQIEEKEARTSRSAKGRSEKRLSLFDESTQEAAPAENVSRGRTRKRSSIFEGSTKEALAEVSQSKSGVSLVILDDTHEVLSPVRPLSPRKSIRSAQGQDLEASISPSARTSSIRRSRSSKSHNLQDSSLTMTSMDKSSSSMISVSSQSFSSFKKGPSKAEETTEIDVVNVSSVVDVDTTEIRRSGRMSAGARSSEVGAESKVVRSIQRQSLPSDMFKDVSCTSTPFHKQSVGRKSRNTETTAESTSFPTTTDSKEISKKSSRQLEMFSISGDSVFTNSPSENNGSMSKVGGDLEIPRRRSSSRSSILKQGEHNCISCRNSSAKRSRSASESSAAGRRNSSSSLMNRSKTSRKSSGSVLEQGYEETSQVKRSSIASANKATPLLHRKSSVIILSENTPEKTAETEDETPKSSIKPARRSSKANQSAYNPLLEDITPVTPEKLMASGFTEEAFKTPINTPGLFESIRKSVIRSRKRHRESTGSVMKASKRARIELPNDDQDQTLDDDTQEYVQKKPQRSPANRLSDFEGVKELMTTPPTSVATRRRSSKHDLTNVPKTKPEIKTTSPKKTLKQSPLTKIASPRHQKGQINKSVSLDGVKQLLKTPRTQKEPVNDLTNVSGVGNLFNLSGVEVLHQGSDIENSEDLFTKMTGKRPIKAYHHRGKSMSPSKQQQQEGRTRKTMGDIPICSPRVQQWVEEHANVMYVETEGGSNVLSEYDEELLKVSDKPTLKSRSGRSISPKKHNQDGGGRRKTQGDALRNTPNVEKWRDDESKRANARKLSIVAKTEPTTPNPNQILPTNNLKIENVTPQQRKSSLKPVTPQQLTPSVRVTPQSQKSTSTQLTPQQKTPQRHTVTPASVRARKSVEQASSSKQTIDHELVSTSSIETKRVSVNKDQETPKKDTNTLVEPPKRGGHTKRIRSNEELDVVTSTTDSPGPQIRETRSRRGNTNRDDVQTKTTAKSKRGQNVNDKPESTEGNASKELVIEIKEIDHNLPASRGRRGKKKELDIINDISREELNVKPQVRGGRGKKADEQNLDLQSKEASTEEQDIEVPKKPTVRGKRGKKATEDLVLENEEPTTEVTPNVRSKRGKKENEDVVVQNKEQDIEVIKKPAVRAKRGKQANEDLVVPNEDPSAEDDIEVPKKPTRGGRKDKKLNEDLIVQTEEPSMEEQDTKVLKKPAVRGKRGKKANEELVVEKEEPAIEVKPTVRGKRGKKENEDVLVQNKEQDIEALRKPAVRGKRGKKVNEDLVVPNEDQSAEDDIEVPKKPTRGGRKGKKLNEDLVVQNEKPSSEQQDTEVLKKPPVRGRRGKKVTEDLVVPNEETSTENLVVQNEKQSSEEQDTEVLKKPPVRGRRGKKVNEDLVVPNEETSTEEQDTKLKKPTSKGKRDKKANEIMHNEEPVAEQLIIEAKVLKQPVAKKTRSKKGEEKQVLDESETDFDDPEVEMQPKSSAKDKKAKIQKQPVAKKTRSKKVEEKQVLDESETDFDDPEVEMQPKSNAKGKKADAKGKGKGKKVEETLPKTVTSTQNSTKRNLRNKVIEEVKEMEVDSPRTARAKRGVNKKYSTDEYEVAEIKGGSKRKVHFEDNLKDESTHATEVDTRKSKRLRK